MKKTPSLTFATIMLACVSCTHPAEDYTQYVNPFVGTDYTGNTYPGVQAPFGMVQLSPDNGLPGWDRIAGYFYPDSTIAGFSHTHLSGTGAGDLYDISFLPVTLPYREAKAPLGIYSKFSHADEEARAGYYKVRLADYGIDVELTATDRCGIQRYTFPEAQSAIILNLAKAMNWDATTDTHIELIDSVTIRGYRFSDGWARGQRVFFCTRFSKPYSSVKIDTLVYVDNKGNHAGYGLTAKFCYPTQKGESITLYTALSGTGMQAAQNNLAAETKDKSFDELSEQLRRKWNEELGKIQIETTDEDERKIFYTALYHSMLAPTIYADTDGLYYGPDKQVHQADGWTNYSTFSLWDTFRAAHPLFTITQPERTNDMIKSFLAFFEQNGRLPVWNMWGSETDMMIGYHAVPVIADAYLKGIGDFDAEKALNACIQTANMDAYRGIGIYKEKGYVPFDVADEHSGDDWSLSRTLEYAFDDYCIAQMAKKMGKTDIAETFEKRSKNYRNVYNPRTTFMQPRDSEGNFLKDFHPESYYPSICESNGWQYFWSVQHDIDGLIELVGGKERFAEKLDSMFTLTSADNANLPIFSTGMIGQYAHGNEPSHHVAYLYNAVGQPWKGAGYISRINHELYNNTPAGLCGNEDCGQMSAWHVFSAMGFYPANPVSGRYELGSPQFPCVQIHLSNGKTFTLKAVGASRKNCYIQEVRINGKPYHKSYITHKQITDGATVEIKMGSKSGITWYE